MPPRSLALAAVALVSLGAGPAPVTLRYRVELTGTVAGVRVTRGSDTGVSGESRPLATRALLALALADSAGGRVARATLDSLADGSQEPAAGPGGIVRTPDDGLPARGATWEGRLGADGRLAGFRVGPRSRGSRQLDDVVVLLMPRVRGPLKSGTVWSDTTEYAAEAPNGASRTRVVGRYRVAGEERVDGTPALRLEAAFDATRTATMRMDEEESTSETATSGTGVYLVAKDGRLLRGRLVRASRLTARLPGEAPVTATGADTVTVTPVE
jgi:hypothetical protein